MKGIQCISVKSMLLRLIITCAPASPELNNLFILTASKTKNLYIFIYEHTHKHLCEYAYIFFVYKYSEYAHKQIPRICVFQRALKQLKYMIRLIELLCTTRCPFSTQLKLYFQRSNLVFEVLQQYFDVLSNNKETSDPVKKECLTKSPFSPASPSDPGAP